MEGNAGTGEKLASAVKLLGLLCPSRIVTVAL